jgi:hypothetical protein
LPIHRAANDTGNSEEYLWIAIDTSLHARRASRLRQLELVEIPLTLDHCHALGVYNNNDAGRRRTLNEAGERVCAVDRSFQSFEARGVRGQDSFLRVVRKPPLTSPLARPFDGAPQELRLLVA